MYSVCISAASPPMHAGAFAERWRGNAGELLVHVDHPVLYDGAFTPEQAYRLMLDLVEVTAVAHREGGDLGR